MTQQDNTDGKWDEAKDGTVWSAEQFESTVQLKRVWKESLVFTVLAVIPRIILLTYLVLYARNDVVFEYMILLLSVSILCSLFTSPLVNAFGIFEYFWVLVVVALYLYFAFPFGSTISTAIQTTIQLGVQKDFASLDVDFTFWMYRLSVFSSFFLVLYKLIRGWGKDKYTKRAVRQWWKPVKVPVAGCVWEATQEPSE